jgi:hypothetical protein
MLELGPPPPPWSLGSRLPSWWAAEPDYPPTTCSGSPTRLLVAGCRVMAARGRGRADRGCWKTVLPGIYGGGGRRREAADA